MALLIAQPPQGAIDQSAQLISSAVNGLIQGLGMVSDRNRLSAFEACFHHATHVVIAVLLVAVLHWECRQEKKTGEKAFAGQLHPD